MIVACVHSNAMEPGTESCISPKLVQGPMRLQKDLLTYIFCVVSISGHIVGDPEHCLFIAIHNLAKGVNIPLPRPLDQNLVYKRRFL